MRLIDYVVVAAIFAAPVWWMLDGIRWIVNKYKAQ